MSYDESFAANYRIKHRGDFLRIQQEGRKIRSKHFLIITAGPLDRGKRPLEHSRLGVTITTKVHKRAVHRNKLKRRLRELFRRKRHEFQIPVDIVLIALQGATELSFFQLAREIRFLWHQSEILPSHSRQHVAPKKTRTE